MIWIFVFVDVILILVAIIRTLKAVGALQERQREAPVIVRFCGEIRDDRGVHPVKVSVTDQLYFKVDRAAEIDLHVCLPAEVKP